MTLRRVLTEEQLFGRSLPFGWGIAWSNWTTKSVVLMPIPLNWIAGAFRALYHRLMAEFSPSVLDKAFQSGYEKGHKEYIQLLGELGEAIIDVRRARSIEDIQRPIS